MPPEQVEPAGAPCPRCQAPLVPQTVRTAIWQGDRLAVIEDVPGHVCTSCMEQFYDDNVSDAMRRLTEDGFPADAAQREIRVPVFSLKGRIRKPAAMTEGADVD